MAEDSVLGTEVDGYRIEKMLGKGGMGVVYRAEDVALSRDVALKRISPSLANDEAFLRRFRSEAQALARVDSPYIVSVHAMRQTDIGLLIVMEYVEGGTVTDLIEEGAMEWEDARPVVIQMLKALEHAHGAEVIHRDIKPQNIMLSSNGTVKVTDFGLAKVHRPDSNKTVTQGVFGTLNYMSPEQVKGSANLDHRSDLYSLGMTVYEMLVGDLPFDDDSSEFTQMRVIVEEELPSPDELHADVPEGLSELVMRSLEKDPDDRYQSAGEMREAFEAFEEGRTTEPVSEPAANQRRSEEPVASGEQSLTVGLDRWPVVAGVAVLILVVAGGAYWLFAANGSGIPTTQLSVTTAPDGATVFVKNREIGTTPFSDATIEGDSATIRVQKAGYVTRDTTLSQLDDTQQLALDLSLTREERSFTVQSIPEDAQVSIDGENKGSAPVDIQTRKESVRVEMTRDGYFPRDTLLAVAQVQDEVEIQLEQRPQPNPPVGDNGGGSNENGGSGETSSAFGRLSLGAAPSGSASSVTYEVDGESHERGSIRVRAGSAHQVRIEHPDYGRCDTTLTVEEGGTQSLTCYFEHNVDVRSRPFAQIFLDSENTGNSTNHTMRLETGETYEIGARILSRPYDVTGGTYTRVSKGSDGVLNVLAKEEFDGSTKSITLRPSFQPETHGLDFRTTETEPSR